MSATYQRRREAVLAGLTQRPSTGDPTLEEIAAGCEQIQSSWTTKERRLRWLIAHSIGNIGTQPVPVRRQWRPPHYVVRELVA